MSDVIDLRLLGSMVARLQSTVEDVRQEYAGIRASLDSLTTSTISRHAEFNVRLSSLELGQMKLAAAFDKNQDRLDRIEVELQDVKVDVHQMKAQLEETNRKLDLVLARLGDR